MPDLYEAIREVVFDNCRVGFSLPDSGNNRQAEAYPTTVRIGFPDRLYEVFDRLKATRREYHVVADAVRRLRDSVQTNQVPAPPNTSLRDYEAALRQLEPAYLVRLWAEFETAIRSYRRHIVGNPNDNIRAFDLINWAQGVEEGRKIDEGVRDLVHEIREYRNSLVHERDDMAPAVGIDEARRRLSTYLSKLPDRW